MIEKFSNRNEYYKLQNIQLQIENPDYIENKIKIDEMKQNIFRQLAKLTKYNMNNEKTDKNSRMLLKVANNAIEEIL